MADSLVIYVPTLTPTLWATLLDIYGKNPPTLLVEVESPELEEMFETEEFDPRERFYTVLGENESNGHPNLPDIAWLDYSEPGEPFMDDDFLLGREVLDNARTQVAVLGVQALTQQSWRNEENPERVIGVRPIFREDGLVNLEIVDALTTSQELLREFTSHLQKLHIPFTMIWLDVAGGASLRCRTALETEAWTLLRTGNANPAWINRLSAELLGREDGLFDELLARDPEVSWLENGELTQATFGDARFRPSHDAYPPASSDFWSLLTAAPDPPAVPENQQQRPGRVLIAGSPHLAVAWKERLYTASLGKVNPVTWELWDAASVTEEGLQSIQEQGPFDLALEVLLGPPDDRQQLLSLITGMLAKNAQVWAHTLNLPATITVQPVPEAFTAVGFGGLPPFGDSRVIELTRPRNSSPADLSRAMGAALAMGLQPIQVADEPGGVSARLLAVLINTAAWMLYERILTSPADVDSLLQRAFGMTPGPFGMADEINLDTIESVMLGLQAIPGGERYRFCPLLSLRIEAGELGRVTEKGFYLP